MITVKLTPQKKIKEVEWKEGLKVKHILDESKWTASSVQTFVNGVSVSKEKKLQDGDELVLVPVVGGG
ncbi:MAG: MoaD/ThiS family protein [Hadesarchaea archaeon]|nr:MoaD/ThiS family protein [Hadesarchaea archaeon]